MADRESYPFATLPDFLEPELRLLFVGINPAIYAVQQGHYFARRTNRFWPALSRSRLSEPIRAALGRAVLVPEDDSLLLGFGIGFTDVVKLPSRNVAELSPADFQEWTPRLLARLEQYRPRVACFNGVMGYSAFLRHALRQPRSPVELGAQPERIGSTLLYVVPSPSPANAHFRLEDQVFWYDRLADYLESLERGSVAPAGPS